MFKSIDELKELIRQGKTNEEIINTQLEYLNSEQYRMSKTETKKETNTDCILFHEGFISPDMKVSFSAKLSNVNYCHDDSEIYDSVINYVRNNMDKPGVSIKSVMKMIKDYFSISETSKYKKLYDFYKENVPRDPYFFREELPSLLCSYKHSDHQEDIVTFGEDYLYYIYYDKTKKEEYKERADRYKNSINWDELDKDLDPVLSLSDIKGAGIAACTEYAMLEQNILSFLGFDTYMIGGQLQFSNGKEEAHNFNAIRKKDGTFAILDSAQGVVCPIPNISEAKDLMNLHGIKAVNNRNIEISYYSGDFNITKDNIAI